MKFDLRRTIQLAHTLLTKAGVEHALIGGMALAHYGISRSTVDVDLLIDGSKAEEAKTALIGEGFQITHESKEVLQFSKTGVGGLDLLLAHRPLTQKMLSGSKETEKNGIKLVSAEGIIGLKIQAYSNNSRREFQDKADIQSLIEANPHLDWDQIKIYAELFDQWEFIQTLRARK